MKRGNNFSTEKIKAPGFGNPGAFTLLLKDSIGKRSLF